MFWRPMNPRNKEKKSSSRGKKEGEVDFSPVLKVWNNGNRGGLDYEEIEQLARAGWVATKVGIFLDSGRLKRKRRYNFFTAASKLGDKCQRV